jgi:hypothetical protein
MSLSSRSLSGRVNDGLQALVELHGVLNLRHLSSRIALLPGLIMPVKEQTGLCRMSIGKRCEGSAEAAVGLLRADPPTA